MYKYRFTLSYNGSAYYGWQRQPTMPTLQGIIEECIAHLIGYRIPIIGSSRTDTGVHALGQVAYCISPKYFHPRHILAHCIAWLPEDISIRSVEYIGDDFHIRQSLYKCYQYTLWVARSKPTPFFLPFVWHIPHLDIGDVRHAIPYIQGTHDFRMFRNYTPENTAAIRTIFSIYTEYDKECEYILRLTFWGTGFVRSMIRNLVGFLVAIGRKHININDIPSLLQSTHRKDIPSQTAPPQGLLLHHIAYPPYTIFEQCTSL